MCDYLVLSLLKDSSHECQRWHLGPECPPLPMVALVTAGGGGGESALCLVLHSQHTYFLSNPHHFH